MRKLLLPALAVLTMVGVVNAQIVINGDIGVSQVWTANDHYMLDGQVTVLPGATLTIEAGTVVTSVPPVPPPMGNGVSGGGSLNVARGAQIFVEGTPTDPVIMTSVQDIATWTPDASHPTGGDPTTGVWREGATEWGSLAIQGRAFISEDVPGGGFVNVPTCNANNVASIEGIAFDPMLPDRTLYGGGDDDDDSGCIQYLDLRYGGTVLTQNSELNGLSLAGVGRGTDISYVEIMNNVDDGIEIFGGAVNLKYISIWNIGDDSLDVDQGWRGRVQFGLIVQGYSLDTNQGGGVGDNCCEMDGAENSDWQPVTTSKLYNMTIIGMPTPDGDHGLAYRDGARVQVRNSIIMDVGDDVIRFDNQDGDGGLGYGNGGTLSWPATWMTPFNMVPPHANDCPAGTYTVQTDGNLNDVRDTVMFNNSDYGQAMNIGGSGLDVTAGFDNVFEPASSPITSVVREPVTVKGGLLMQRVTFLDPLPQNDGLAAVTPAPVAADPTLCQASYRGAFAPGRNWLAPWSSSYRLSNPAAAGGGPMLVQDHVSPNLPNGQPGDPTAASLDISHALNSRAHAVGDPADLFGPHVKRYSPLCEDELEMTIRGEPSQIIILLASPLGIQVGSGSFGPGGQADLAGFPGAVQIIGNGASPGVFNSLFRTDANGEFFLDFPSFSLRGLTIGFQGIVFNGTTVIRGTNAVELTVL